MTYITLAELKAQCKVEDNNEDALLTLYGNAAEEIILKLAERSVEGIIADNGGTFPQALKVAILMLANYWYDMREAGAGYQVRAVPYGIPMLVKASTRLGETEDNP